MSNVETITKEEMEKGTQPTRGEKIMFTPLEEVLAKETWDDVDVEILVANAHQLDEATRAKLGIVELKPLSEAEVIAQTATLKQENPIVEPEVVEPEKVEEVVVTDGLPTGDAITVDSTNVGDMIASVKDTVDSVGNIPSKTDGEVPVDNSDVV